MNPIISQAQCPAKAYLEGLRLAPTLSQPKLRAATFVVWCLHIYSPVLSRSLGPFTSFNYTHVHTYIGRKRLAECDNDSRVLFQEAKSIPAGKDLHRKATCQKKWADHRGDISAQSCVGKQRGYETMRWEPRTRWHRRGSAT